MKNFSQFVNEASTRLAQELLGFKKPDPNPPKRVEWIPQPKLKPDSVSTKDFQQKIKTDAPKKEQPEGHTECKTCEGTGETKNFTGRAGVDKETGVVHAQYLRTGCSSCGGKGHINPNPPSRPPYDPYRDPRWQHTGAGRATWTGD